MNEDVACRADDLTTVADGQAWQKLLLGSGGTYEVAWDTAAAVTPMGSLVYFAQYLNAGGLLDDLVVDCPLEYKSGNEQTMLEAESRGQGYLFKLRQTTKVRAQIERLERTAEAWIDAGEGWQGTEVELKLMGWTRARRCIFLRRRAERTPSRPALPASTEFDFVEVLDRGPCYEYLVLVTNTDLALSAAAQAYRDRADCKNVFDEIKNQWGWAGFVTQDLRRCRIMFSLTFYPEDVRSFRRIRPWTSLGSPWPNVTVQKDCSPYKAQLGRRGDYRRDAENAENRCGTEEQ